MLSVAVNSAEPVTTVVSAKVCDLAPEIAALPNVGAPAVRHESQLPDARAVRELSNHFRLGDGGPSFIAVALGELAPNHIRLLGRNEFLMRRADITTQQIVCLAVLEPDVELLPADQQRADLALGRHSDAPVELTDLVNQHPLRERLTAQLMLALYRTGRQADALAAFHRLRIALADELGIDPGADISALHERILRQDPDLTESRSTGAYPRTTGPVPAQLRHGISNFMGRTEQLAAVHAMLDEQDTTMLICAIDGVAGIGKTEFALHFAHQISDRFPDGQLYFDLRGFGPEDSPVSPEEALGQSLRALGVDPAQIPADMTERASLYRSMLAGRRVLVVLDNARDPEQVRPLLPCSPAALVLVTSRATMAGLVVRDGARQITLGVLPVAESVDLLGRIVGPRRIAAEAHEAHDLVALCGQLPLALRIVAHRIAAQPQLRLADLVAELRTGRDRLDVLATEGDETSAVRSVFSWSYRTLASDVASAFRLLSLRPGAEFGLPAASAILAVPPADTHRLLLALTGAHLVQGSSAGRYQSHDLMRLYAVERAVAEETEHDLAAAVRRALEWYLGNADAAGAVLVPIGGALS